MRSKQPAVHLLRCSELTFLREPVPWCRVPDGDGLITARALASGLTPRSVAVPSVMARAARTAPGWACRRHHGVCRTVVDSRHPTWPRPGGVRLSRTNLGHGGSVFG